MRTTNKIPIPRAYRGRVRWTWTQLPTSFLPQTLRWYHLAQTWLDNTRHDIIWIIGTRPIPLVSRIRCPLPLILTDALVEADAIAAPLVGTSAADTTDFDGCCACGFRG